MSRLSLSRHGWLLLAVFAAQVAFWNHTHRMTPDMGIVPNPPSGTVLSALSFGDPQFMFRLMAFQLGNAGDTFGRNTALYQYDLAHIETWFTLLDDLDETSNLLPSNATYYFGQTQTKSDVKYMVNYLRKHAERDITKKWWWQAQAAYLAMHKLEDQDLALEIALPLKTIEGIPMWARQMAAFVYEKKGEMGAAFDIIQTIAENAEDIPQSELNFMRYFVDERLERLDELSDKAAKRLEKK